MGYSLSKPYALKIFDTQVQKCLAFGDHLAVCRMMTGGSKEAEALRQACSEDDVKLVARAKCEGIVIQALQNHVKKKGKKVAVAELVALLKLYAQCAASEDSLLHPMKTVLKTVLAVVDCKHADVGELCDAVDLLEELKKQTAATAVGQNKSVLLEFLVGSAGQLFFEVASATVADRHAELGNQQELQLMQEEAKRLRGHGLGPGGTPAESEHLQDVVKFWEKAAAIKARPKSQNPWTKQQLESLQGCVNRVTKGLGDATQKYVAD